VDQPPAEPEPSPVVTMIEEPVAPVEEPAVIQVSQPDQKTEKYTAAQLTFLQRVGLGRTKTVAENLHVIEDATKTAERVRLNTIRKKYEYLGLLMHTEETLDAFIKEHDLRVGKLPNYIYTIPVANIKELGVNLNKVLKATGLENFARKDMRMVEDGHLRIIAPATHFNGGGQLTLAAVKRDPAIIFELETGIWAVLTMWE
jgi:hypothetical protein